MSKCSRYKGGIICHLLFFIFINISLFYSCGDFIREERPLRDIRIYSDVETDDIAHKDNLLYDIYESDLDNKEETDSPIISDISLDSNIFPDTDSEYTDIIIDTYLRDDTASTDITSEFTTDTNIYCDCDAGPDCGLCLYPGTEGLRNQQLKDKLYQLISNHTSLGYDKARVKMFSEIDNKNGWVECVYTGFKIKTNTIPDSNIMNTEHTWPQSMGAGSEPARSDLFHLFPTKSEANSRRGNYPFGTVINISWTEGGSKLGTNSRGDIVFEPRDIHKGNVARAMFYFSVRYRLPIDNQQESELKKWHQLDPVDEDEISRCNMIYNYQKNRNPFVDWPPFVDNIEDF